MGEILTKCLEKNPYLIKNSVDLQPRWEISDPQSEMVGVESNPDLTKSMIELCNTNTIATISHGIGSIESLNESLIGWTFMGRI